MRSTRENFHSTGEHQRATDEKKTKERFKEFFHSVFLIFSYAILLQAGFVNSENYFPKW